MKYKISLIAALVFSTVPCLSQGAGQENTPGGELVRPGTGVGSVAILNAQTNLPYGTLVSLAAFIEEKTGIVTKPNNVKDGNPTDLLKDSGSDLAIIVRSDANAPTLLVAPEDRWCVINVKKLTDDLPAERAKQRFFIPRARKEIIKGFSLLCGGGYSQFPNNIMNAATVRELDSLNEQFPVDMIGNYSSYVKKIGLKPKDLVPYEYACQEGWAPQPTNDIQKAIWDKVHAPPEKPIKITYDKDKQKPVVK